MLARCRPSRSAGLLQLTPPPAAAKLACSAKRLSGTLTQLFVSMPDLRVTAIIFGGGVAGLWTLDELRRAGHAAILVDIGPLGLGQTIASQGILHSGLKYSLAGMLTPSAREARQMPQIWRQCLQGESQPNLADTQIASESFLLWGTDSASSRLGLLGAKLGLQVTPQPVAPADRPDCLRSCTGAVYRVDEQVISPATLVAALAQRNRSAIVQIDSRSGVEFSAAGNHAPRRLQLKAANAQHEINVTADWLILAAGRGNAVLREELGLAPQAMQIRPLHMVLVRGELPDFFGHCVDGAKTRVSITSARDMTGRVVWQIGGQISEDGVALDRASLLRRSQAELQAVLPALDLRRTEWATYRVDRAEGITAVGGRPESYRLLHEGDVLTAWPTKLVLAPQLARAVVTKVATHAGKRASAATQLEAALGDWPRPSVAQPPWDQDQQWTSFAPAQCAAA